MTLHFQSRPWQVHHRVDGLQAGKRRALRERLQAAERRPVLLNAPPSLAHALPAESRR